MLWWRRKAGVENVVEKVSIKGVPNHRLNGIDTMSIQIFICFKIRIKGDINPVHMQIIISLNPVFILDTICNYFLIRELD